MSQRKLVEWTVVSSDGVFGGEGVARFRDYQDDAYYRDGLGLMLACDAAIIGRTTYQGFAALWPGRDHMWADAFNDIRKYVFSATLERADWSNSTIIRGNPIAEVAKLKQQPGRDLIIWGHGLLTETLLKHGLVDVVELDVHPLMLGKGQQLCREGLNTTMRLAASKTFAKGIVKLRYELQPG